MATKTKTKTKTKKAETKVEETALETKETTTEEVTETLNTNYRVLRPKVDIVISEEAVVVYADMPGVSKESLDVTLDNQMLTLHGKSEKKGVLYQRGFKLSAEIDLGGVSAEIS